MRFREFFQLSEAKFNKGQIKRQGLDKPTTLRRNIEGWDVWFRDQISELPESSRKKRNLLHALDSHKVDKDIIQYIQRAVKSLLSRSNKLSLNKFQKAAVFRGNVVSNDAIYSPDKDKTKMWSQFAKAVKLLDTDNLDPKVEVLAAKHAHFLRRDFMGDDYTAVQRWFPARLIDLLNTISGTEFRLEMLGDLYSTPNKLFKYIHGKMEKAGVTRSSADDKFNQGVEEDIKEEFLSSVRHVIDMFKTYHVQFKDDEVKSMMENVKKVLHDAVIYIATHLGNQIPAGGIAGDGEDFRIMITRQIIPKLDMELEEDVKNFVHKFIGNVRQSRSRSGQSQEDLEKATTTDGLVNYLAHRATVAIKHFMSDELKAGKDTDETQFQSWMEQATKNFKKVVNTLHALGIRKFARVPVVFNYQDWEQKWSGNNNVGVGGLHYLGNKRMQNPMGPQDKYGKFAAEPYKIGAQKHEHHIQMYNIEVHTIAHEIGHAVYALLPKDQQVRVRILSNYGPTPSHYGSPDYIYTGSQASGYAHQTGNEWFAEMLGLLTNRPELLNTSIQVGKDTREFTPKGSDKPLTSFPDKPNPISQHKQVKDLNAMVRKFKQIFATQSNDYRGYKLEPYGPDSPGKIRMPRRLRGAPAPQQPNPQPPSSSNPEQ